MRKLLIALSLFIMTNAAFAVNPDEVLDDPALEARARTISAELRCVVCRGESIDESNASIARDLRLLVRERLIDGDTDSEVIDFVVDRYGEYVLMRPNRSGANILLWAAGPILFLLAAITGFFYLRRRSGASDPSDGLSRDEQARLKELLEE